VRDLASVGSWGPLIWVGEEPYVDRTVSTITMSRMGYIKICLNSKYSYMLCPMD
jgi:hypothetical protein